MTEQGYINRISSVEWHCELYRRYGLPQFVYEKLLDFLTETINADYYGGDRPTTDDERFAEVPSFYFIWFASVRDYLDGEHKKAKTPLSLDFS